VFHRVDPGTFTNCTNCHLPHVWVANGDDCNSCHAELRGPEGTAVAHGITGTPVFPHDRHARLECSVCHRVETRHADLLIAGPEACTACHHGPPAVSRCTACHPSTELAGQRSRATTLQLVVWPAAREMRLPFDHARHDRIECERCHQGAEAWRPADNCASCHTEHHRPEAACMDCHAQPAADAHALDVHTGGCRSCHGPMSATSLPLTRNHCLVCHQDQVRHMSGGNCADCHKLTAGTNGGAP
jgi:hypothetical protein